MLSNSTPPCDIPASCMAVRVYSRFSSIVVSSSTVKYKSVGGIVYLDEKVYPLFFPDLNKTSSHRFA